MSKNEDSDWGSIELPIVRKVFPEMLAKKFVEVQPLSLDDYMEGKEK